MKFTSQFSHLLQTVHVNVIRHLISETGQWTLIYAMFTTRNHFYMFQQGLKLQMYHPNGIDRILITVPHLWGRVYVECILCYRDCIFMTDYKMYCQNFHNSSTIKHSDYLTTRK